MFAIRNCPSLLSFQSMNLSKKMPCFKSKFIDQRIYSNHLSIFSEDKQLLTNKHKRFFSVECKELINIKFKTNLISSILKTQLAISEYGMNDEELRGQIDLNIGGYNSYSGSGRNSYIVKKDKVREILNQYCSRMIKEVNSNPSCDGKIQIKFGPFIPLASSSERGELIHLLVTHLNQHGYSIKYNTIVDNAGWISTDAEMEIEEIKK